MARPNSKSMWENVWAFKGAGETRGYLNGVPEWHPRIGDIFGSQATAGLARHE